MGQEGRQASRALFGRFVVLNSVKDCGQEPPSTPCNCRRFSSNRLRLSSYRFCPPISVPYLPTAARGVPDPGVLFCFVTRLRAALQARMAGTWGFLAQVPDLE